MWWTLFIIALVAIATTIIVNVVNKRISVRWYEWLIGVLGVFFLCFGLQNMVGMIVEGESQAAILFAVIFGILAAIFIAIPIVLAIGRNKSQA